MSQSIDEPVQPSDRSDGKSMAELLRQITPAQQIQDNPERIINEWCEILRNEGVASANDLLYLTDDAVSHMRVGSYLKSVIQKYLRSHKGDGVIFSREEEEKVARDMKDLTEGFLQWYAVVGIISALMVSITVEPLTGLEDVDSGFTQAYAVFMTLSFVAAVGSIMTLCHVVGMLTGTMPKDRLWFFVTFYEKDAMLPNILMVTSVLSLALAMLLKAIQDLGNVPAMYVIAALYGIFLVFLVWWVLWRFPKRFTRHKINTFLQESKPFVEKLDEAAESTDTWEDY